MARQAAHPRTLGRYQVLGELTAGGMAQILLGRLAGPAGFARPVVIKRILPHLAVDQNFVVMLQDEARIVAQINHSNVVQVHELGQEDGEVFLVMEYLEGETAADMMRRLSNLGRTLSPRLAAYLVAEASAGLAAAHAQEIVHRDISPENIFVTYDGTVKVLDFGVAKARHRLTRTVTGHIKGKYCYMSPEQLTANEVDQRSDVFSLGIVLHELVTGRPLFRAQNPIAIAHLIVDKPIESPSRLVPTVPARLSEICLAALQRDVALRTRSSKALAKELRDFMSSLPGSDPSDELRVLMEEIFADAAAAKRGHVDKMVQDWMARRLPAAVDPEAETDAANSNRPEGKTRTPWTKELTSPIWDDLDDTVHLTDPTPSAVTALEPALSIAGEYTSQQLAPAIDTPSEPTTPKVDTAIKRRFTAPPPPLDSTQPHMVSVTEAFPAPRPLARAATEPPLETQRARRPRSLWPWLLLVTGVGLGATLVLALMPTAPSNHEESAVASGAVAGPDSPLVEPTAAIDATLDQTATAPGVTATVHDTNVARDPSVARDVSVPPDAERPDRAVKPPPDRAVKPPPDRAVKPRPDRAVKPPPDRAVKPPPPLRMVTMTVTSKPAGARISVEGGTASRPITPTQITAPEGRAVRVTFSLTNHVDKVWKDNAQAGKSISAQLTPTFIKFPDK